MTTIKFDKSVKYKGVRYAAHEAFKVADEDVAQLKKAGATVLSTDPVTPPQLEPNGQGEDETSGVAEGQDGEGDEDVAQLKEKLLECTVPELTAFAQERGIDLQGKTRKADIYNIIVATLD